MATGAAIALGNFDGLHAGHRAVIDSARREAKRLGASLGVATFEPAPRRFFQPDAPPFRLMTPTRRQIALDALGVDELHLLRFDAAMAGMTDREFCERVVVGEVGAQSVSVGFDFRFGKGRMGDADSLRRIGGELGFDVCVVSEVKDGGTKVSSSGIRMAIERGDMQEAQRGLGEWWITDAIVQHGEKRGRTLGFPTANMALGEIVHPAHGVYAVWAREDGDPHWHMEPMTGYELLQQVRASDKLKTTPFIMVTAESKTENVIAAKKAGVNNYIVKPFNAETLKGKLKAVLGDF